MEETAFQPGDRVSLKTNLDIIMIVAQVETSEKTLCYWFNPVSKELNKESIPNVILTKRK